jgi:hypothetical protein
MVSLPHQHRPCEATRRNYDSTASSTSAMWSYPIHDNHGSTVSSTSAMWSYAIRQNHGSTASSTSAVWIRITTMVRLPHQRRPCEATWYIATMAQLPHQRWPCWLTVHPCNHRSTAFNVGRVDPYYNHGSTASLASVVWIYIATMGRPPH